MPICVTGIPGSGLSLVADTLEACGVDRVPAEEMIAVNANLLDVAGGAWDMPPDPSVDFALLSGAAAQRVRASKALRAFDPPRPWLWVDPAVCLTLPFWRALIPNFKVILCVRNPYEAIASLRAAHGLSSALATHLWTTYYARATGFRGAGSVVSHYASHLFDGRAEAGRLSDAVGVAATTEALDAASRVADPARRHHEISDAVVGAEHNAELARLYLALCAHAGPHLHAGMEVQSGGAPDVRPSAGDGSRGALEFLALRRELVELRLRRAEAEDHADRLRRELEESRQRLNRRVRVLQRSRNQAREESSRQAALHEEQLAKLRGELEETRAEKEAVVKRRDSLRRELDATLAGTSPRPAATTSPLQAGNDASVVGMDLVTLGPVRTAARGAWQRLPRSTRRVLLPFATRVRHRLSLTSSRETSP